MIKAVSKKVGLVLAVASAAIVGGATTAVVLAAIPDSGGTIHGCYKTGFLSNGGLRVVDSPSQACGTNETGLNWSNGSSSGDGAKGYVHIVYNYPTNTITFDAARSKNIIQPDPQYPRCYTLTNGVPTSIAGFNAGYNVEFKDQNGWTDATTSGHSGSVNCDSVPGANIFIDPGGNSSFMRVY